MQIVGRASTKTIQHELSFLYICSSHQVWCGCGKEAKIAIFNTETLSYTLLPINTKESKVALTKMALMGNEVKRR